MCATLAGQILNVSYISKSLGISVPTVNNWLSILERSYILFRLPPYFSNIGKRLIKSPKLYFYDTGLIAYLLELDSPEAILNSSYRGPMFENMVIAERIKSQHHSGKSPRLYYFRDSNGLEIDIVEEKGDQITLTEIKSTTTYGSGLKVNLEKVNALLGGNCSLELVYGGKERMQIKGLDVIPWND